MQGFAPARRGPFLSRKGPKTISARARWDSFAPRPNHGGEQLATLKQVRQRALFGQGLSRAQGRDSLQRRHSRESIFPLTYFSH